MVIGSVVYVEGNRIKRNIDQYCALDEDLRNIGWFCMEKFMPAHQKEMYQTITSCFDKISFDQVLNLFCGLTNQERIALILEHIHCFQNVDMESFGEGPTIDTDKSAKCVAKIILDNEE